MLKQVGEMKGNEIRLFLVRRIRIPIQLCSLHIHSPGICICWDPLKILPSSHSTATWCIMVNVSMWCLPTTAHKDWCARYYYRNNKESYTF